MINNYFKADKQHQKIRKSLLHNDSPDVTNQKIKKKISKLNEFQHFNLFCDVFIETSFYPFILENLSHFTKRRKKSSHEIDEFFPRSNSNTSNPVKDYFLTFNCKKDLTELVQNYLQTKEYPKDTLISKLLVLKEYIIKYFIEPLVIVISTYKYRLKESNNIFIEDDVFLFDLLEELQDIEEKYLSLINEIDSKVNSFSREIKGNYLIDTGDEILKQLYKGLEEDFIDIHETTEEEFIEVLKSDWDKHNSVIHLKMDNIQFKFLIICLEDYLNIKIQLSSIEFNKNIRNKNGIIKALSVSSSYSAAIEKETEPKQKDKIVAIFEKIKKINI
ncbi:hypothetical protein [Flavobacterium sp.]|uniref:hypothetical protein n=1 Tax=Flavobacterium sp. TaxID=239 RepID=UPI0040471CDA